MQLDDNAAAYHFIAKSLDGKTQAEGDALPADITHIYRTLSDESLQVEVTALTELPDTLK